MHGLALALPGAHGLERERGRRRIRRVVLLPVHDRANGGPPDDGGHEGQGGDARHHSRLGTGEGHGQAILDALGQIDFHGGADLRQPGRLAYCARLRIDGTPRAPQKADQAAPVAP